MWFNIKKIGTLFLILGINLFSYYYLSGCLPSTPPMNFLTSLLMGPKPLGPAEIYLKATTNKLVVTENGQTDSFNLVLSRAPSKEMTIILSSSDVKEVKFLSNEKLFDAVSLTITPSNWENINPVVIQGIDDQISDGNKEIDISVSSVTGDDDFSKSKFPSPIKAINVEKSFIGVSVSNLSGNTTETGGEATFTAKLTMMPSSIVTVCLSSTDITEGDIVIGGDVLPPEGTCSTALIKFDESNWKTDKIIKVKGINDSIADGDVTYSIVGKLSSSDPKYNNYENTLVQLKNLEDSDKFGITVANLSGNTTEVGGTATFTIRLNSQPTDIITVCFESDNTQEGQISIGGSVLAADANCSQGKIEFTTSNWSTEQTVTLAGIDDTLADGDVTYSIKAILKSSDAVYNGNTYTAASLKNIDNDLFGIIPANLSGDTQEPSTNATFTIKLASKPAATVNVCLVSSNEAEGKILVGGDVLGPDANCSSGRVEFDSTNWNTVKTVTIEAVDDFTIDGNIVYKISATAYSADPTYNGKSVDLVNLSNVDNDTAGIYAQLLVSNPYYTAEYLIPGANADGVKGTPFGIYEFRLASQPTGDVHICIESTDTTEIEPAVGTGDVVDISGTLCTAPATGAIIVTPAAWNTLKTIQVRAVQDILDDNYQTANIKISFYSTDSNYNINTPTQILSIVMADDDGPEIKFTHQSSTTVSEDGATATFKLWLNSTPSSSVTICLKSSLVAEGIISSGSQGSCNADEKEFIFTNTAPETITVQGVEDTIPDGRIPFNVTYRTISSDTSYNGKTGTGITFYNVDNEKLYWYNNLQASPYYVYEAGSNVYMFKLNLRKSPTAPVIACIQTTDTSYGDISPSGSVFVGPDPDSKCPAGYVYVIYTSSNTGTLYKTKATIKFSDSGTNNNRIYLRPKTVATDTTNHFYKINIKLFSNDPDYEGQDFNFRIPLNQTSASFATDNIDASFAALNKDRFMFNNSSPVTTQNSFRTTKVGGTFSGSMKLATSPTADVKVCLKSSNTAEGVITTDNAPVTADTMRIFSDEPNLTNFCGSGYQGYIYFIAGAKTANKTQYSTIQAITVTGQNNPGGHKPYQIIMNAISADANYNTGGDVVIYELTNVDTTALVQNEFHPSTLLAYLHGRGFTILTLCFISIFSISLMTVVYKKTK